jgi:hypothetical protein
MRLVQGPNGAAGASAGFGGLSVAGGALALQAGMALAAKDLLTIDEDGLAYKVTDAAFVTSPNAGASIIANTSPISANFSLARPPIALPDGTFVVYNDDATNSRHVFSRYSRAGALLRQETFNYTAPLSRASFFTLSNGNLAFVWINVSELRYRVFSPTLDTVVGNTLVEPALTTGLSAIPLSGGGFAVLWSRAVSTTSDTRFAIYDNAGAPVLAPTTLLNTPAGGIEPSPLAQFANGNILVIARPFPAGQQMRMGVFTATGSVVTAFAPWAPGAGDDAHPRDVSVLGNAAALAWTISGTRKLVVVNQLGAQQGATVTVANVQDELGGISHDGADFLALTFTNGTRFAQVTRLPATGTGAVTRTLNQTPTNFVNATGSGVLFLDNEFVLTYGIPSTGVFCARIGLDGTVVNAFNFTLALVGNYHTPPVPLGPGVIIISHGTTGGFWSGAFSVRRYRSCAIQGVAAAAAVRLATVQAIGANGTFECNPIVCTTPTNFNHNATNVIGQRGTLYPRGVAFRGLV